MGTARKTVIKIRHQGLHWPCTCVELRRFLFRCRSSGSKIQSCRHPGLWTGWCRKWGNEGTVASPSRRSPFPKEIIWLGWTTRLKNLNGWYDDWLHAHSLKNFSLIASSPAGFFSARIFLWVRFLMWVSGAACCQQIHRSRNLTLGTFRDKCTRGQKVYSINHFKFKNSTNVPYYYSEKNPYGKLAFEDKS